jgi:hypothetical protein
MVESGNMPPVGEWGLRPSENVKREGARGAVVHQRTDDVVVENVDAAAS